jgi:putative transposase
MNDKHRRVVSRPVELHDVPSQQWAIAEQRLAAVRRLVETGILTKQTVASEAQSLGISIAFLYRLLRRYRQDPSINAILPQKRGVKAGDFRLSPDAEAIINQAIADFYLTRQKVNLTKLRAEIIRRCHIAKIEPPRHMHTIKARIDKVLPSLRVRAREGPKAANDKFRPVTSAYVADYALRIVQFDHTRVDLIVVDNVYRQPLDRPWLTLGIDVASRMVVGYYLTMEAPSVLSIGLALTQAVTPKGPWLAERGIAAPWAAQGIPDMLHLDNATEFHSEAFRRGCIEHDIKLHHRPVATPHYGGHIERLIGTMMGEIHLLPGTTFSNIQQRGAYDSEKEATLTLSDLDQLLATQIIIYNNSPHAGLGGLPPNLAWEDAMKRRTQRIREPADQMRFFMDFLPCEMRMVRRDGIRLMNIHYWDNVLSVWAGQTQHKMLVRYDPRNMSKIYLRDPEGTYWTIPYRNLARPPITLWELRRAEAALKERGRTAIDETLIFDAVTAQRALLTEAAQLTKQARRQAQRTVNAIGATLPFPNSAPLKADDWEDKSKGTRDQVYLPFKFEDWT